MIELISRRISAGQKQTIRQITHKLIGPKIIENTDNRMTRTGKYGNRNEKRR
jgi:hypothetical protein